MGLEQQLLLNEIQRRAASGQIGRRQFLHLAAAIGVESTFAVALADQVIATPSVQDPAGRSIESSYDYNWAIAPIDGAPAAADHGIWSTNRGILCHLPLSRMSPGRFCPGITGRAQYPLIPDR
jgi:hypothetical protein